MPHPHDVIDMYRREIEETQDRIIELCSTPDTPLDEAHLDYWITPPEDATPEDILQNCRDYFAAICAILEELTPEELPECECCTEEFNPENSGMDNSTHTLCGDCLETFYSHCVECSGLHQHDDMARVCDDWVCERCQRRYYSECDRCGTLEHDDNMHRDDNIAVCERCYDRCYYTCENCGCLIPEGYAHSDDYGDGVYCEDCYLEHTPDNTRDVEYTLDNSLLPRVPDHPRTFGVEIEVEFDGGCPFTIGGYHSDYPAPPEYFYGGWHGEEDGSLDDGGEFISPPLNGFGGIAEIIATYRTLKNHDARVSRNTGQHVTVQVPGSYHEKLDNQLKVQRLAIAVEEALIASTGSFYRLNYHYCRRLKHTGSDVSKKSQIYGRTIVCGIKHSGLVEFRYPPGTLNPAQAALNIGLCQLIVDAACKMSDADIDAVVAASCEIESEYISERQRVHKQIQLGLQFFADWGWHPGGTFTGLGYDAAQPHTVKLYDYCRGHRDTVTLPCEDEILARLTRQLAHFYNKMGAPELLARTPDTPEEVALYV